MTALLGSLAGEEAHRGRGVEMAATLTVFTLYRDPAATARDRLPAPRSPTWTARRLVASVALSGGRPCRGRCSRLTLARRECLLPGRGIHPGRSLAGAGSRPRRSLTRRLRGPGRRGATGATGRRAPTRPTGRPGHPVAGHALVEGGVRRRRPVGGARGGARVRGARGVRGARAPAGREECGACEGERRRPDPQAEGPSSGGGLRDHRLRPFVTARACAARQRESRRRMGAPCDRCEWIMRPPTRDTRRLVATFRL